MLSRHQSAESYSDSEQQHLPSAVQLTLTPSSAFYESSIQFAPNVTPSTYPTDGLPSSIPMAASASSLSLSSAHSSSTPGSPTDSPTSRPASPIAGSEEDPFAHYAFYEALDAGIRKKKTKRAREDPNYIPRPPNSFMLFRWAYVAQRKHQPTMDMSGANLSRVIGTIWNELSDRDQGKWNARAASVAREHAQRWPGYKFEPHHDKEKKAAKRAAAAATTSPTTTVPRSGIHKVSGAARAAMAANGTEGSKKRTVMRKGKEARFAMAMEPSASASSADESMPSLDETPLSSSVSSSAMHSPLMSASNAAGLPALSNGCGPYDLAPMQIPSFNNGEQVSISPIDLQALSVPHVPSSSTESNGGATLVAPQARHALPSFYSANNGLNNGFANANIHMNAHNGWGAPMNSGLSIRRSSSVPGLAEFAAQTQGFFHPHPHAAQFNDDSFIGFNHGNNHGMDYAPQQQQQPQQTWLPAPTAPSMAFNTVDFSNAGAMQQFQNAGANGYHGPLNGVGSGFVDLGERRMSLFAYGREISERRPSTAAPAYHHHNSNFHSQFTNNAQFGGFAAQAHQFQNQFDMQHQGFNNNSGAGSFEIPPFVPPPIEHRDVVPGIFADNYSLSGSSSSAPSSAMNGRVTVNINVSNSPTGERNSFDFNAMSKALPHPMLTVDPNYSSLAAAARGPDSASSDLDLVNSAVSATSSGGASYATLTPTWAQPSQGGEYDFARGCYVSTAPTHGQGGEQYASLTDELNAVAYAPPAEATGTGEFEQYVEYGTSY